MLTANQYHFSPHHFPSSKWYLPHPASKQADITNCAMPPPPPPPISSLGIARAKKSNCNSDGTPKTKKYGNTLPTRGIAGRECGHNNGDDQRLKYTIPVAHRGRHHSYRSFCANPPRITRGRPELNPFFLVQTKRLLDKKLGVGVSKGPRRAKVAYKHFQDGPKWPKAAQNG